MSQKRSCLNDFYSFDIESSTWSLINATNNSPSKRYSFSFFNLNNKLYLFGGTDENNEIFNDCYKYSF